MKRMVFLCSLTAALAGCQSVKTRHPDPAILRVGVTPRSRPMVFEQNGQIMGIEADFARELGRALQREVVFTKVPWDKQIEFLENNKTDIIMSNMSITPARQARVEFTTPYLQSGLSVLFRRDQHDPSGLLGSVILNQTRSVGFVENTTGEFYCLKRFTRAKLKAYPTPQAGVAALKTGKIDMFVHDAPVIWWHSAQDERGLVSFQDPLTVEPIAWGVGRHNPRLLGQVNALIEQWERDGTSGRIIKKWLPRFK